MKFNQTLMTYVKKNLEVNLIPMLIGEPGIGKSSWLTALADLMKTKCFTLACNQLADKADLTGARLVPVDANDTSKGYKQVFYPHAIIHDAIEYAENHPHETPILFLDELNRTTPDVTSECLSIPTLRSIGSKKLPNNLRVVIAGNDKGNVTTLDEASISRFVLYHVEPDTQTFLGLDPELNIFVKNVLQAHPECIFGKNLHVLIQPNNNNNDDDDEEISLEDIIDEGEDMQQITTPRTISAVSNWLNTFSNQELMEGLANTHTVDGEEISDLQEAIEGHVGKTNFSAFLLAEIANGVMNTNNQANTLNVQKPACYDALKACPDMTTLTNMIDNMLENDRSGALLYALYENTDNSLIIKALSNNMDRLHPTDLRTFMQLMLAGKLDSENTQALLATQSKIAETLSVMMVD